MASSGLCTYKDEVTELKDQLNNAENQRNPMKYKQLIQQVILYMTKGIDMTALFTTIVKAAATKDLVQKKLCYLFLCHYASSHADLALLTVNTLKRDAEDTNYMVRGLALRSMGSLRLNSLVQYTKDAMIKGLKDHSSYVKNAAVIGCLQLYKLAPQEMDVDDLIKQLNAILTKDKDMQVRRNCIFVLEEMFVEAKDSTLLHNYLLKRLQRFDEWGLQFTLDLLMRSRPEKEEDVYSALNCLDSCLKHANTSVVLGAIRVFLHYTSRLPELKDDVFSRIKVPLLTALSSKSPEIVYSVACHIEIILHQSPTLFEDSVSSFYCRYNDPVYLKIKKLGVLSKLVTESNGKQILDELSYYAQHSETAAHCIQNIGMMALLHPSHADMCIEKLFSFLQSRDDLIVSHSLAALRDLVIKYDKYTALLPSVSKYLKLDLLPDGKASVVWMLGEFGENIPEGPYALEALIDDIEKETSPVVKLELLTATMKLFFKRPPECQAMLGHLLEYCIEQEYNMDIRDRALLYYRLLEVDVKRAREVICCPRSAQFIDNANIVTIDSKESLLDGFNTLSVLYGQMSSAFTEQVSLGHKEKSVRQKASNHRRKEITNETGKNDVKKLDMNKPKVDKSPVAVDTSLVQIDEDPSQVNDRSDSLEKPVVPLGENLSTLHENVPIQRDIPHQTFGSKDERLLPIDEDLVSEDSNPGVLQRNESLPGNNLVAVEKDLHTDNINSMSESLVPVNESSVPLQAETISLDEHLEQVEERSSLEENQISVEHDGSSSFEAVEGPGLSPEMFETLWRELPETESYEVQLDKIPDQSDFLKLLRNRRIYTMASTPPGAEQIRFFLYAQSDRYILCEVCMDCTTLSMNTFIKMEDPTNVHSFIEVFQNCVVDATTS